MIYYKKVFTILDIKYLVNILIKTIIKYNYLLNIIIIN